MATRINNPKMGHKIIVMQRVHEQDLSGHVLEKGGYEHLMIPMRFEEKRCVVTCLGIRDPRSTEDELAWPERYDAEATELLEQALGPYGVAGQFQQTPTPRSGTLFDPSKIKIVDALPAGLRFVRGWDFAATEEKVGTDPAWTAGFKLGKIGTGPSARYVIADVTRGRWGPSDLETTLKNTADLDGKAVEVSMPQDPGQAGKVQAANYIALLSGYKVEATPETGSKLTRAEPFAAQVNAGNVSMLRGPWNTELVNELKSFPSGKYKDQVDAGSRAFGKLIDIPSGAANILEWARQQAEKALEAAKRDSRDTAPKTPVSHLIRS
jgi:predicted phage terminase large subunit-like protein